MMILMEMLETLRRYGIKDERVLEAMAAVDRREFVPGEWKRAAYEDRPLPIGWDQTISQPYTVARMIELLIENLKLENRALGARTSRGNLKVLEVGTGSGYQTAILARLFDKVYSVEVVAELARRAEFEIRNSKFENVRIKNGDGKYGWKKHAPYQAIIVAADAREVPGALIEQLAGSGRIVIPVMGEMRRGTKAKNGVMQWEKLEKYLFVPLV